MWARIKALFSRAPKPGVAAAPPAPEAPEAEDALPAESAPDSEHNLAPPRDPSRDPLLALADEQFLGARQLAHSLKLEATIGISQVQQRYKMARYAPAGVDAESLAALREPIASMYSERLGQELLLLAFARSLRRRFHKIVADAVQEARKGEFPPDDLRNQLYHLSRAQELAATTKLCLEAARKSREAGDPRAAEALCSYQIELLQRQINVRVPLDDAVAKAAVHQWMGFLYQAQGKAEEADSAFHRADEISPPHEEYRDPVAEALGEWRTYDLDHIPEDGAMPPRPVAPTPPALSPSGPIQRTASEMLRVDLPEPPDIFGGE